MKKRIVYITLIASLFAMSARSQVRFGVKAGWNVNQVTWRWKQLKENIRSDNRNGFFAGVTLDVTIPIAGLGVDFSVLYDNRIIEVPTAYEDVNKTMEYIVVPVNLLYNIGFGDFLKRRKNIPLADKKRSNAPIIMMLWKVFLLHLPE